MATYTSQHTQTVAIDNTQFGPVPLRCHRNFHIIIQKTKTDLIESGKLV